MDVKVYGAFVWEKTKNAFWVIPLVVTLVIMATLFLSIDLKIPEEVKWARKLLSFKADAEGARTILGSIATSIMTVVGVLFSITVVVLQQASNQYTPRVIQNFVRSSISQLVLGFFIGTFIYCLLLLTNIQGKADSSSGVPQISLTIAIVLALMCMVLLISYIHHITKTIQSTELIAFITRESIRSLKNIIQDRNECSAKLKPEPEEGYANCYVIKSEQHGYLQNVEWRRLVRATDHHDWRLDVRPFLGSYVHVGDVLFEIRTNPEFTEKHLQAIHRCFIIGEERTNAQDPRFGIRKLVDIGLRAMSPGINDPSTAQEALNGITSIAIVFAEHHPIPHVMSFKKNRAITVREMDAEAFIGLAYDQLLQFAEEHMPVTKQLYRDLNNIVERTQSSEVRDAVMRRLSSRKDTEAEILGYRHH